MMMWMMSSAVAVEFYVATDGSDGNPGTKEKPFATLEKARDAARTLNPELRTLNPVLVWVKPGVYERVQTFELDARDSFTTYRAESDGVVRLFGAKRLPASSFNPLAADAAAWKRLPVEARGKSILCCDLKALGITDYGTLKPRGYSEPLAAMPMELFMDGRRMSLAQWPNAGMYAFPRVTKNSSIRRNGQNDGKSGVIRCNEDRISSWVSAEDAWLAGRWSTIGADQTVKLIKVDPAKKELTVGESYFGYSAAKGSGFTAVNLIEELDAPGEYYIDRTAGVLLFLPALPLKNDSELVVTTLEGPMVAIEGATQVVIRGIDLECSRGIGIYMAGGKDNTIAGCRVRNVGTIGICVGEGEKGREIGRLGYAGAFSARDFLEPTWDRNCGTGHRIVGCDIADTGAYGIVLGGGERKTLTPGKSMIENCVIRRAARTYRFLCGGVYLDGVGNRVANCRFEDMPDYAIGYAGNNQVIELNDIAGVGREVVEGGAIYCGWNPTACGSQIRHNFIHDLGEHAAAVFFDFLTVEQHVIGNVLARTEYGVIYSGAQLCELRGNVVVGWGTGRDQQFAEAHNSARRFYLRREGTDIALWRNYEGKEGWNKLLEDPVVRGSERMRAVAWEGPLYAKAYKALVTIAKLGYRGQDHARANYLCLDNEPSFIDPADDNFQLKPEAPVFATRNFDPIPFESIGLKKDEFRSDLPPRQVSKVEAKRKPEPRPMPELGRKILAEEVILPIPINAGKPVAEFWVATDGNDTNPGTKEKPFATLEKARDAARTLNPEPRTLNPVLVWVKPGVYERAQTFELDARDSFTTYRAESDGAVRLLGAKRLPVSAFKPLATDDKVWKRLPPEAKGKTILACDLQALGITDYGTCKERGFSTPLKPMQMELYRDGQRMILARWPNQVSSADRAMTPWMPERVIKMPRRGPYFQWDQVVQQSSSTRNLAVDKSHLLDAEKRKFHESHQSGKVTYLQSRPDRWAGVADGWVFFTAWFYDQTVRLLDVDAKSKIMTLAESHYGYKGQGESLAQVAYAFNLMEELDAPGEYYIDRKAGVLYFLPHRELTAETELAVTLCEGPLVALENTTNVLIRGISLEYTRGMGAYIVRGAHNRIASATIRGIGTVGVCIGEGENGRDLGRIGYGGGAISKNYFDTMWNRNAGVDNGVVGCDIYDIGSYGVSLGGGDRKTLTPGGNFVENCSVHDCAQVCMQMHVPVSVDGVGNRVRHCRIYNDPHAGIMYWGNEHLFELNNIGPTSYDAAEGGGFYIGRDITAAENLIRHNYLHDIPLHAYYFDDAQSGQLVIGNVMVAVSDCGVNNGGQYSRFEYNVQVPWAIVDDEAVNLSVFNNWRPGVLDGREINDLYKKRVAAVKPKEPPFSERYPWLATVWETPYDKYLLIKRDNNFRALANDAAFVDPVGNNWMLKPDAAIFKAMPDFKPIPFDKIGLYKDEFRNTIPAEFGVYAPDPGAAATPEAEYKTKPSSASSRNIQPARPAKAGPATLEGRMIWHDNQVVLLAKEGYYTLQGDLVPICQKLGGFVDMPTGIAGVTEPGGVPVKAVGVVELIGGKGVFKIQGAERGK
jgi:hypothetical protein